MRLFGAPEEVIRQKLGLTEEDDEDEDKNHIVFEVLEPNWDAVRVFQFCQPQMFAGMSSFVWTGIQAVEILAACRLLLVKRAKWPEILEDVNFMGILSARLNNRSKGSKSHPNRATR